MLEVVLQKVRFELQNTITKIRTNDIGHHLDH